MITKQTLIDRYDRLAPDYARAYCDELSEKPFDRWLLESFAGQVPAGKPICDLGCGPGHLAYFLKSFRADVLGIDLSPGMVTIAEERYPSIEFQAGDMLALDLPETTLGGIAAFYSIIHIDRNDIDVVFSEMFRVLVGSGYAVISLHRGDGTFHEDESVGKPIPFDCTLFQPEEVVASMEGAGFSVEHLSIRKPYPQEFPTERVYVLAQKPGV